MLVILEITIALISIKKLLYQCNPPYTKRASSHRVLYLEVLSTYNICIIYLHVIQACVNVTVSMFYFSNLKNASDVMKNIFNSISIYSWKKNFLVNKHKKQKCYKENKSLFSNVMKNGHIFLLKVCHFQHDHRFLSNREMENIRAYKGVRLKMKNRLVRVFLSHSL